MIVVAVVGVSVDGSEVVTTTKRIDRCSTTATILSTLIQCYNYHCSRCDLDGVSSRLLHALVVLFSGSHVASSRPHDQGQKQKQDGGTVEVDVKLVVL